MSARYSTTYRKHAAKKTLAQRLKAMVGFRNLAVHQYCELDIEIVEHILAHELDDLMAFAE